MPKSTSDSCCDDPKHTVAKGGGEMGPNASCITREASLAHRAGSGTWARHKKQTSIVIGIDEVLADKAKLALTACMCKWLTILNAMPNVPSTSDASDGLHSPARPGPVAFSHNLYHSAAGIAARAVVRKTLCNSGSSCAFCWSTGRPHAPACLTATHWKIRNTCPTICLLTAMVMQRKPTEQA